VHTKIVISDYAMGLVSAPSHARLVLHPEREEHLMILTMEGTMYPTVEDEYGFGIVCEPTHTDEDEAYYTDYILSGLHDEGEADYGDWREDTYDADFDGWESDMAADRWERAYWGD
jgi:hypothetical protein